MTDIYHKFFPCCLMALINVNFMETHLFAHIMRKVAKNSNWVDSRVTSWVCSFSPLLLSQSLQLTFIYALCCSCKLQPTRVHLMSTFHWNSVLNGCCSAHLIVLMCKRQTSLHKEWKECRWKNYCCVLISPFVFFVLLMTERTFPTHRALL